MPQHNTILILGPGNAEFGAYLARGITKQWLESRGIQVIGDGKKPVDYEKTIAFLNFTESVGTNTRIFVRASGYFRQYGQGLEKQHYLALDDSLDSSSELLRALQTKIVAYNKNRVAVPWVGDVVLNTDYGRELFEELDGLEKSTGNRALKLTRALLVGAGSDDFSVGWPDSSLLTNLTENRNPYKFILEENVPTAWAVRWPGLPVVFRSPPP